MTPGVFVLGLGIGVLIWWALKLAYKAAIDEG